MRIRSLVVLTHALQGLPPGSMIGRMLPLWRAEGRSIVVHQGLERPPAADACLLHVDLTVVPLSYLALMQDYPIRINARTADISRRRCSDLLVGPEDGYGGPVIVKTDRNYYGRPEARLQARSSGRRLRAAIAARLPARWTGRLPGGNYLVLPDKTAVPRWIWRAPGLTVERFLGKRGGASNRVGLWYFLGRRSVVCPIVGRGEVLRFGENAWLEPMEERVGPAAEARRQALGFDFGKFDVIESDGQARVIDTNRTPFCAEAMSDYDHELCRRLAPGLDDCAA